MENRQELVSVIMPVFNAERYVGESIKSVLEQTYQNFELIIVDDGSKDRTAEIVETFNDSRIKLIRHPYNMGVAEARNTALKVAKGKWIAPIDADDKWLPERLEKLIEILKEKDEGKYFVADDHIVCFDSPTGLKPWGSLFKWYHVPIKFPKDKSVISLSLDEFLKWEITVHPIFPLQPVKSHNIVYQRDYVPYDDAVFYYELFRIGLMLRVTKVAFYLYRLTPNSISTKEPPDTNIEAVEYLLSKEGFSDKEKRLLIELKERGRKKNTYLRFTYFLKRKNFNESFKIALENPFVIFMLFVALPRSLKYRLIALLKRGSVR